MGIGHDDGRVKRDGVLNQRAGAAREGNSCTVLNWWHDVGQEVKGFEEWCDEVMVAWGGLVPDADRASDIVMPEA